MNYEPLIIKGLRIINYELRSMSNRLQRYDFFLRKEQAEQFFTLNKHFIVVISYGKKNTKLDTNRCLN